MEKTKCLIIGSGPAGYTAAIYASRADLKPIVYQGMEPGGQLTTTTEVDNFPGYPEGIDGPKMMEDLQKQAERFGADIRWGVVTDVDTSERQNTSVWSRKRNLKAAGFRPVLPAMGFSIKEKMWP